MANEPPFGSFVFKVNYTDNPFVSAETIRSAERARSLYPERYKHVWLGELDESSDDQRRVLPLHFIDPCIKLPEYAYWKEPVRAGFDIADEGDDRSAIVIRQGPVTTHMHFIEGGIEEACNAVYEYCEEYKVSDLWYDATSIGIGARDRFRHRMPCKNVVGINFGNKVSGKNIRFDDKQKNSDLFQRKNAQMGWNLRMRAEQTRRTQLEPDLNLDPRRCLYILPDAITPEIKAQLAQPVWTSNMSGHIVITKKPKGVYKSPDIYDAAILAFAHDCRQGIKSGGRHLIHGALRESDLLTVGEGVAA